MPKLSCPVCSKMFYASNWRIKRNKFNCCSKICADYLRPNKTTKLNCDYCGVEITKKKSMVHNHNFCSLACMGAYTSEIQSLGNKPDFISRHPEIKGIWKKISQAKKSGELKQKPCEVCGRIDSIAHHDGYNKPLDVRWLCRPCHYQRHKTKKIKFVNNIKGR